MSHRPWPGDETGRAKLTSREIALQEQPLQPVQPHRDTPVWLSQWSGCYEPPPSPHGGRFVKAFWDLLGSGPDVHVDTNPAIQLPVAAAPRAGACPRGWGLPMGLTDQRDSDRSLHPNPAFLHAQRRLVKPCALCCSEV